MVNMGAAVAVCYGSVELLSIALSLSLAGTHPWHARGSARIRILGISIRGSFDETWGDPSPPPALPAVDVEGLLVVAVSDPRAWAARNPSGSGSVVSLRDVPVDGKMLVAHPLATVSFTQHVVPLGVAPGTAAQVPALFIDRLGAAPIARGTGHQFWIVNAWYGEMETGQRVDVPPDAWTPRVEQFAVSDFVELSDEQRLTAPMFVPEPAGVDFGTIAPHHDRTHDATPMRLGSEVKYIAPIPAPSPGAPTAERLERLVAGGAAARAQRLRATGRYARRRVAELRTETVRAPSQIVPT
jgi:hypothetical protein